MKRFTPAVAASALLLILGACAPQDEQQTEATPGASPQAELTIAGEFQITGEVQDVDTDAEPELDLDQVPPPSPLPDADETAQQRRPDQPGQLTLELRTLSGDLETECNFEQGDTVEIWWTENTRFDPANRLDDLGNLDGETVSIQGRIVVDEVSQPDQSTRRTPMPDGPAAGDSQPVQPTPGDQPEAERDGTTQPSDDLETSAQNQCTLIADHVQVGGEGGAGAGTGTGGRSPSPAASPGDDDDDASPAPRNATPGPR